MIKQIIELVEVNYDISFINYNAVSQCSNKMLEFYMKSGHMSGYSKFDWDTLQLYVRDFIIERNKRQYQISDKIRSYLLEYNVELRVQKDKSILVYSDDVFGFSCKEIPDYENYTIIDAAYKQKHNEWDGIVYNNGYAISCVYIPDQQLYNRIVL